MNQKLRHLLVWLERIENLGELIIIFTNNFFLITNYTIIDKSMK